MEAAEKHLQDRLDAGENDSVLSNDVSPAPSKASVSKKSSLRSNTAPESSAIKETPVPLQEKSVRGALLKRIQTNASQAEERLKEMEDQQQEKEIQMQRVAAELELSKQRTEEARKIAKLNHSKAEKAEEDIARDNDTIQDFLQDNLTPTHKARPALVDSPVRLKGVDLPKFSGDGKTEYSMKTGKPHSLLWSTLETYLLGRKC